MLHRKNCQWALTRLDAIKDKATETLSALHSFSMGPISQRKRKAITRGNNDRNEENEMNILLTKEMKRTRSENVGEDRLTRLEDIVNKFI